MAKNQWHLFYVDTVYKVFHSNYRSVLLGFQHMTTGWTTDVEMMDLHRQALHFSP